MVHEFPNFTSLELEISWHVRGGIYCPLHIHLLGFDEVRLVGDKVQGIKVNESLLAFLEIVGDRRGDVIVIDPLRVLHIA